MKNIFEKRINILPYEYPSLLAYKDAIRHSYWIHSEFNFTTDIDDYKTKISNEEREVIKRSMLAIAQIEVNVKTFWADLYKRMPITEIGDVGMTFAECHGEGTEILTPKGWVNFKDIDNNTEVIQYDLETNTMTSVLPSNIINEPYKGKMHRIENQTYNALLTPNHNIYYKTRSGNIIKKAIKDIGKFSSDMKLPFSGKFVNEGVDELSLDDKINIGNFDCIDLSDKSEKWCNSFIYELTKLEGSKLDSDTQNGDYVIKHQTISKLFADNLQVIGIFAGYVVDITNDKDIYNVSFVKTNTFSSITDKPTIEDYDGNIYCVTVPTGCIVTRYNDKVLISGNSEVRHKDAYAQLLRILGLENEFQTVIEIPAIKNRISYLAKYLDGTRSKENKMYTKSVLLFSLFIEHVSLFSQFLIMMSFNKEKNLFKGISNVVEATSKEEEIHGNFGSELINIIKEENPEWFDEEFEALIVSACHKAYAAECGILDWIFENGELSFLSKDTIKHFIQNRFNNSLNRIGMKSVFEVDFTEIEKTLWFDVEILSTKEGDFFYKKSVDYNKKSKSITEDDLF
jgi:ribonucleotide reductase beta subunit family protein with ferritin-like domain